jgi:TatD DNase family protein
MQWAVELGLPVALHSRDAFEPCLEVVQPFADRVKGVFHCFSGSVNDAKKVLDVGYFLGIGGNITYKNNPTLATLQEIGLQNVVLETDSPYLTPVPFRGKPNQPAYVRYVAEFLALGLQVPLQDVADITTQNAKTLFRLTS